MTDKKKEKQMSEPEKKKLDLDLGEITGGRKASTEGQEEETKKMAEVKPIKPEKKKTRRSQKHSYMLTFPTKNPSKFTSKDILDCTGEEFLEWAHEMHPFITRPAEDFDSRENRLRAFNQILIFHKSGLTWLRSRQLPKDEVFH